MPSDPGAVARDVLDLVTQRGPTLGEGRLVCIDGPAGSGKTTLARALAARAAHDVDCHVVHCDELLQGWRGLPGLGAAVAAVLEPLARGESGRWRRWDWLADGWAETHDVRPGGLLVLEGVGCWSPGVADLVGVLAWVEAPSGVRLQRGIERDGEQMRTHWLQWRIDEHDLFERLGTRSRADIVVSTDDPA